MERTGSGTMGVGRWSGEHGYLRGEGVQIRKKIDVVRNTFQSPFGVKKASVTLSGYNLIRTSIHDEYDLMLFWFFFCLSCGYK